MANHHSWVHWENVDRTTLTFTSTCVSCTLNHDNVIWDVMLDVCTCHEDYGEVTHIHHTIHCLPLQELVVWGPDCITLGAWGVRILTGAHFPLSFLLLPLLLLLLVFTLLVFGLVGNNSWSGLTCYHMFRLDEKGVCIHAKTKAAPTTFSWRCPGTLYPQTWVMNHFQSTKLGDTWPHQYLSIFIFDTKMLSNAVQLCPLPLATLKHHFETGNTCPMEYILNTIFQFLLVP